VGVAAFGGMGKFFVQIDKNLQD